MWYQADPTWDYTGQINLDGAGLKQKSVLSRVGGRYFFQADLNLTDAQPYVIDFKNSSVIGHFTHRIFDDHGRLVQIFEGGIQSDAVNPFMLRHGRELNLPPGHYRLIGEIASPFYLAQPEPYIDTLAHYSKAIQPGDALTFLCMGVLLSLAFYFATLTVVRRSLTDAMYCMFIIGNLLYNGMALLIYPEFFNLHWFYLISTPILFSNCAYVIFVLSLLGITLDAHPRLFAIGTAILTLFACFIVLACIKPGWSLELDRIGVGLITSFGLAAGIVRARQGDLSARFYTIAVGCFFVLGMISISLTEVEGLYTFYVEHLGLFSVTVEALLLALVIASQFTQMSLQFEREKRHARHDELTGLQNRRSYIESGRVEVERARLNNSSLAVMFLDLDNFKQLNDTRGHHVGDVALRTVARALQSSLRTSDVLGRLGGDEFCILLTDIAYDDMTRIGRQILENVQQAMLDFPPVSVSIGATWFEMADQSIEEMIMITDELMYEVKEQGKSNIYFRVFDGHRARQMVLPLPEDKVK